MAVRILANLIVMGSGIIGRAVFQAYRQALERESKFNGTCRSAARTRIGEASKTGVAQEAMQSTTRKAGQTITEQEARQILGVSEQTSWDEILQKYDKLFENV